MSFGKLDKMNSMKIKMLFPLFLLLNEKERKVTQKLFETLNPQQFHQ
jgi:hypothetical protein